MKLMDLESTRLKLIEITWNDLENIHRLHTFPEVDEFNTLGIPKSIEETREVIRPVIEDRGTIIIIMLSLRMTPRDY